ncbi:hypothetical protein DOY81_015309 [Sarcophaga bullata]|nr:hypothetical protein DOY81_015309 [Sarcophaga bullata]
MQLNRVNESKNLMIAKEKPQLLSNLNISTNKPQVQGNLIIAKEKPNILRSNQPVVVAKPSIQFKPTMAVDEPDELLTVRNSDENTKISNAKRMKFDEYPEVDEQFTLEKIVPVLLKKLKGSLRIEKFFIGKRTSSLVLVYC